MAMKVLVLICNELLRRFSSAARFRPKTNVHILGSDYDCFFHRRGMRSVPRNEFETNIRA